MVIELFHQKLIEVMLVNGIKKPKPLYNVCPKTMLLSILQQTLSIHQVQLLTSLQQTKKYRPAKKTRENATDPTKQFTTYIRTLGVSRDTETYVKQFQNTISTYVPK